LIDQEIQLALDAKQDEILTGMPVPRDGKIGDIRTNVTHKGRFYQTMKTGINTHFFSAPFTRTPSIHTMDDYLLKSGGRMLDDRRIYFRDTGLSIYSSADGQLDIDADTELEITAPTVDINASTEVNISNNLTVGGDILLSNGNYVGISAAERLEFYTAGYAAFMGCNVGIGTSSPGANLHIQNTGDDAILKVYSSGSAKDAYAVYGLSDENSYWMTGIDDHDNKFLISYDTTDPTGNIPAPFLTILVGGNVGIGTATPGSLVEAYDGEISINRAVADTGYRQILFQDAGATMWTIGQRDGDHDLHLYDASPGGADDVVVIKTTTGYVGFGTATPQTGFHNVGTTRLGDQATNYSAFAADGILTMTGTAMVTNSLWLGVQGLKEAPVGLAAAYVNHGVSGAWQFTDGQQDGVAGNIRIPNRMYRTTAPTLTIGWSSTATEKKCEWQIEYIWRAADEDTTAGADDTLLSSTDAGGTSESSSTAEGLTLTTFTLAAPGVNDNCLHFRIRRIGDDAVNDTLDADAELHGMCMNYTSDKLGTAT